MKCCNSLFQGFISHVQAQWFHTTLAVFFIFLPFCHSGAYVRVQITELEKQSKINDALAIQSVAFNAPKYCHLAQLGFKRLIKFLCFIFIYCLLLNRFAYSPSTFRTTIVFVFYSNITENWAVFGFIFLK